MPMAGEIQAVDSSHERCRFGNHSRDYAGDLPGTMDPQRDPVKRRETMLETLEHSQFTLM